MKLYNILKNIILEVSLDQVTNSVKNKNLVTIYYDGDFCVGVSKAGNRVLRAWEREGASYSAEKGYQPLPGWRLFRLDRIGNYSVNPRENFVEVRPKYNPDDKGMVGLKVCANFEMEEI
jgi:hypothetical protein